MTVTLRSNLESHVDVLRSLEGHGPIYFSNFEVKGKMAGFTLRKHLEFLVQNRLFEKQPVNRQQVLYTITERGQKMLELFSKLTDVLELENQNPPKTR